MIEHSVLVKVPVDRRPPRIEGKYDVIFFEGTSRRFVMTVEWCEQYSFHHPDCDCTGITHWLHEVFLPTDQEISEEHQNTKGEDYDEWNSGIRNGIKLLRDTIISHAK